MSNKPIREWYFYIDDMIRFSQKVIRYTHNHDQTGFMEDIEERLCKDFKTYA